MTPKEKAEELIAKYKHFVSGHALDGNMFDLYKKHKGITKREQISFAEAFNFAHLQCTKVLVYELIDEIINELNIASNSKMDRFGTPELIVYWQEVKNELENINL